MFFCHVLREYTPLCRSVGRSPCYFFGVFELFGSYPVAPVIFSSTAPAHPHATRVTVYLALFNIRCGSIEHEILTATFSKKLKWDYDKIEQIEQYNILVIFWTIQYFSNSFFK